LKGPTGGSEELSLAKGKKIVTKAVRAGVAMKMKTTREVEQEGDGLLRVSSDQIMAEPPYIGQQLRAAYVSWRFCSATGPRRNAKLRVVPRRGIVVAVPCDGK